MSTFPTIQSPSFPLGENYFKSQIKSEFESGYVQSRPKATVGRRRWILNWTAMPESDYQALRAFYEMESGNAFDWIHPQTAIVYRARFSNDELNSEIVFEGHRRVNLEIEEAPEA